MLHYAGNIIYNAEEFLVKNKDSTHPDTQALFESSSLHLCTTLFADKGAETAPYVSR